ncbi:MAG TPA: DoxX family protein [Acidimicrobiia bacterium]|nr:DoxX family protein [Acidimicrobiia bacterium]
METVDFAMLALRVWLGVVMIAHGINHARSIPGTTNWFRKVGFRAPRLNALLSAGNELAIGLALLAGLLTSVAAAGLAATMVVAFWSIHRFAGFFVFHRPDEGYEYVVTLAVVALAIAIVGPGSASLDDVFGIDLSGATGALIYGAGLVAAGLQLAVFWRKPEVSE